MRIHFCPFDKTCRSFGAPARLHVTTGAHQYILAFTPNARVQKYPYGLDNDKLVWFQKIKVDQK